MEIPARLVLVPLLDVPDVVPVVVVPVAFVDDAELVGELVLVSVDVLLLAVLTGVPFDEANRLSRIPTVPGAEPLRSNVKTTRSPDDFNGERDIAAILTAFGLYVGLGTNIVDARTSPWVIRGFASAAVS